MRITRDPYEITCPRCDEAITVSGSPNLTSSPPDSKSSAASKSLAAPKSPPLAKPSGGTKVPPEPKTPPKSAPTAAARSGASQRSDGGLTDDDWMAATSPSRSSQSSTRSEGSQRKAGSSGSAQRHGDHEPPKKSSNLVLILALVGAGMFTLLLLVAGGAWYLWSSRFSRPSEIAQNSGGFPQSVIPEPSIPQPVIPEPSPPVPDTPQTVVPHSVVPHPVIPQQVVPQPVIPQPSVPLQPQTPIGPAIAGADRRIKYQWKQGDTHTYQFSVNAGEGNDSVQVTGSCTYTVGSDVQTVNPDEEEGTGTGFVVSPDGYLATCAHVVEGAKRIEVVLGEKTYSASVISIDVRADVALLRIGANGLSVPP